MNKKCRKDCNLDSHFHNQQLDLSIDPLTKSKQTKEMEINCSIIIHI